MKWSWKIGALAGIELWMHITFLLLLGWVGATHWLAGRSVDAAVNGMAFILALSGCVLLHEPAHSLAARQYGIPTRDITLLPIGGVGVEGTIREAARARIRFFHRAFTT